MTKPLFISTVKFAYEYLPSGIPGYGRFENEPRNENGCVPITDEVKIQTRGKSSKAVVCAYVEDHYGTAGFIKNFKILSVEEECFHIDAVITIE